MKRRTVVIFLLVMVNLFSVSQEKKKWTTAYYALWAVPTLYSDDIDYRSVTHLVHFSTNPVKKHPYLNVLVPAPPGGYNQDSVNIQWGGVHNGNNPPLWQTIDLQKALLANAHSRNVKVLLSVGGIYGDGAEAMSFIAQDAGRIEVFVKASCAYAKRKGYDGIEIDWEVPRSHEKENYIKLIRRFRHELDSWSPRGEFITAVFHTPWEIFGYDKDAMNSCFDQINVMTYEMYAGDWQNVKTGYSSPLEVPTQVSGYNGFAINQKNFGVKEWIRFGIPSSKLGLGISFLTTEFYNVKSPVQPAQSFGWHNWGYIKNIPKEGRHWDPVALVPWQASGTTFITYEDTQSVRMKVEYAKQLDLGGVMLYDLLGGYVPNAPVNERHQLLKTAWRILYEGTARQGKK